MAMNEITVKFGGKEFILKKTMSAMLVYEQLTGKKISELTDSITDLMTLFYCILKAKNKEFTYSFEEFIDLVDESLDQFEVFANYLGEETKGLPKQKPKKK